MIGERVHPFSWITSSSGGSRWAFRFNKFDWLRGGRHEILVPGSLGSSDKVTGFIDSMSHDGRYTVRTESACSRVGLFRRAGIVLLVIWVCIPLSMLLLGSLTGTLDWSRQPLQPPNPTPFGRWIGVETRSDLIYIAVIAPWLGLIPIALVAERYVNRFKIWRCIECGYELPVLESAGMRCPECGTVQPVDIRAARAEAQRNVRLLIAAVVPLNLGLVATLVHVILSYG